MLLPRRSLPVYSHASSRASTGQTTVSLIASSVGASDHELGVSVLAEIGLPDILITEQRLASVLQNDLAHLQDITVVGE
jgi:hypothetical protein